MLIMDSELEALEDLIIKRISVCNLIYLGSFYEVVVKRVEYTYMYFIVELGIVAQEKEIGPIIVLDITHN